MEFVSIFMNSQLLLQVAELPNPSSIQWKAVEKTIITNDKLEDIPLLNLEGTETTADQETIKNIIEHVAMINKIFMCNTTEIDACHKVFFTFLPILNMCENIQISSFTDYMFHFTHSGNNKPFLIVEVKRQDISCHIGATKSFAQMLREVHILSENLPLGASLPFILTNSFTWALGYCTVTKNRKLHIASGATIQTPGHDDEGYKKLLRFFKGCVDQISQSS